MSVRVLGKKVLDDPFHVQRGDSISAYIEGKLIIEKKFDCEMIVTGTTIFEAQDFLDYQDGVGAFFGSLKEKK